MGSEGPGPGQLGAPNALDARLTVSVRAAHRALENLPELESLPDARRSGSEDLEPASTRPEPGPGRGGRGGWGRPPCGRWLARMRGDGRWPERSEVSCLGATGHGQHSRQDPAGERGLVPAAEITAPRPVCTWCPRSQSDSPREPRARCVQTENRFRGNGAGVSGTVTLARDRTGGDKQTSPSRPPAL